MKLKSYPHSIHDGVNEFANYMSTKQYLLRLTFVKLLYVAFKVLINADAPKTIYGVNFGFAEC